MSTNPQPGSQPKPQQPTPAAASTPTASTTPAASAPAKPQTPASASAPAKQKPAKPKKKVGLNSVVSWGASVVIIGLMFKISPTLNSSFAGIFPVSSLAIDSNSATTFREQPD